MYHRDPRLLKEWVYSKEPGLLKEWMYSSYPSLLSALASSTKHLYQSTKMSTLLA